MRNKIMLFIATVIVAVLLGACGGPDSGKITDRSFTPEKEWYEKVCAQYKTEKVKVNATKTNTKQTCVKTKKVEREIDEVYQFHLDNGEEAGWVTVTEDEYNSYQNGDQYP